MRIVSLPPLVAFYTKHADAQTPIQTWIDTVKSAAWQSPNDVKADFASASIIGNRRVVFNIKGNTYRLITAVFYDRQTVLIKFAGTHAEYDRVDALTVEIGD